MILKIFFARIRGWRQPEILVLGTRQKRKPTRLAIFPVSLSVVLVHYRYGYKLSIYASVT